MARGSLFTTIMAAGLVSAPAYAAPITAMQTRPVLDQQAASSEPSRRAGVSGGTWIVSVLALLAVVGGIVAAASGDRQLESP
jgi:hypothetical protein